MATLTIRNLPADVVARLKARAASRGHSMEEEARQVLQHQFRSRTEILKDVASRWKAKGPSARAVNSWIEVGRERG